MKRLSFVLVFMLVSFWAVAQDIPPQAPPPADPIDNQQPSQPLAPPAAPGAPDPSARTIDQLRREIGALKDVVFAIIDGKFAEQEAKAVAAEKDRLLIRKDIDDLTGLVKDAIASEKALTSEKFAGVILQFEGIQKQFDERDVRVEQAATGTKTAIDAALQAQEKSANDKSESAAVAIAKSEAATTKQIDSITELIAQGNAATNSKIDGLNATLNGKVDDVKARLQAIESKTEGQSIQKQDTNDNFGLIFGIIGAVVGVLSIFGLIGVLLTRQPARTIIAGPTTTA